MISKEEAIEKFKEILGAKASWTQLKDSQFVQHLAIFVSWALRQALYRIERSFQEYFRSTAVSRSSILAHVEDENYIPTKAAPSVGTANIKNNGTANVVLLANQPFFSDTQEDYILVPTIEIAPGDTETAELKQLEITETDYPVTEEMAFYEILFDQELSDKICGISVQVDLGEGAGFEPWTFSSRFQNVSATAHVYDEFYAHTAQTGIRFGNGVFGLIPPLGSTIKIILSITNGETTLNSGQSLSIVGEVLDSAGEPANVKVTTVTPVIGGTDMEGYESIRRNLQYWPIYNGRLVWKEDYEFFIKKRFPNVFWARAWGEQEATLANGGVSSLDFVNKIFISAYAEDMSTVEVDVIAALEAEPRLNRTFEWVDPVVTLYTITVSGKVSRARNIDAVNFAIRTALLANYGATSASLGKEFILHECYAIVQALNLFSDTGEYFTVTKSGDPTGVLNEFYATDTDHITLEVSY